MYMKPLRMSRLFMEGQPFVPRQNEKGAAPRESRRLYQRPSRALARTSTMYRVYERP